MKRLIAVLGLCIASVSVSALASSVEQWSVEGWTWESSSLTRYTEPAIVDLGRGKPLTLADMQARHICKERGGVLTAVFDYPKVGAVECLLPSDGKSRFVCNVLAQDEMATLMCGEYKKGGQ